MYPNWPESAADLGPLPECPGPKLGPFDFQGPQNIEFLEKAGEGLHAIVFKVRILGQIYALKVFRWLYDFQWEGYGDFINRKNPEGLSTLYNYTEPFNAECRAFGRLMETGCEELAIPCFGYVLLDEDHERALMTKFNFTNWTFNGSEEESGSVEIDEQRLLYPDKNGRSPPLRCIVKAFGQNIEGWEGHVFSQKVASRLFRSIIKLQKLGIINIDFATRQIIDGRLSDFSTAITFPHFMTNPELNPYLSSAMIKAVEMDTFAHCITDYKWFDEEIGEWNYGFGGNGNRLISIEAFPGRRGCPREARYNLRGSAERTLYTLVDPRRYGWTANQVVGGVGTQSTSQKRRSGRASKAVASQSARSKDPKRIWRKLTARQDRWHYQCEGEDEGWLDVMNSEGIHIPDLQWACKDGYMFPTKYDNDHIT
ncbi:kinetochore Sim4 complex subunit FTA2-domain-containing protein [Nemania serpens]|nr:kinetochore Sim4 complex subunit FTA2-domain-containing protein [Nemania serpens]